MASESGLEPVDGGDTCCRSATPENYRAATGVVRRHDDRPYPVAALREIDVEQSRRRLQTIAVSFVVTED